MREAEEMLASHPAAEGLAQHEIETLAALLEIRQYEPGEDIAAREDFTGKALLVVEGAVELVVVVADGIERIVGTCRAGTILGALAFLDRRPVLGAGRAIETTRGLVLERDTYDRLSEENPALAHKVQSHIVSELCARFRLLGDQFMQSVSWGMKVSGALQLNLQRLVTGRAAVTLQLLDGRSVTGVLLKVDESLGGVQIYLRPDEEEADVIVVPYHAVVTVSVPGGAAEKPAPDHTGSD